MKTAIPLRSSSRSGMTLLEITVILAVLLSLTSILAVGTRAWKSGADRSSCLMNIRNTQMSVRSYQNLYGYEAGGMPYAENGTQDIAVHMFAKGYITFAQYNVINGNNPCDGGGTYVREHADVFPPVGKLYVACSLAETKRHELTETADW